MIRRLALFGWNRGKSDGLRYRFTLKHLLLGVTVVAVLFGSYVGLIRQVVRCRPADADDIVHERYVGIDIDKRAEIHNIAVVEGTFTKSTWLTAVLYSTRSGQAAEVVNAFVVGRSPARIGEARRIAMKITLALGSWDSPSGRVVQLGSAGQTRGSGQGGSASYSITPTFARAVTGHMVPGRTRVIYAEGGAKPVLDDDMTLEDFIESNRGDFFVVTARLDLD